MKKSNFAFLISISIMFCINNLNAQQMLTKEEAVKLALDNNYDIKIANNNVQVAENNTSVLNSGYLPTVTGTAGATYNLDNTEAEFSNGNSTVLNGAESNRYNAGVSLNYTIFDGLGRHYNYKRLKEQYQLSELQARETIENTIVQLFSVYYNVAQLSENLETLDQTLLVTKDRLVRAEYQFDYGQNTKLEVLNAEVDINTDSINIINTKQDLKIAKRDLKLVLGETFTEDFNVETEVDFLLQFKKDSLFEKAKQRNVALLQTEKNIAISQLDIKSGKSAYLPTLGLTGSYGWNKNNNNAASFVTVSTNTGLFGGLNLSWNLFDGGATITRVRNAKVNLETQQLQKENILLSIQRDFDNAWDDYMNKLEIYNIQEKNIITAQNNFDRTQEKFKIGQVNSIEFRQAQLNLLNTELSRNQAKYAAKLAELQLLQISGELLNVEF
ncbi:outer membrane protein TolC [Mesoflavibacter sabulilitoris]|uniref:Transporter n=1 Tax=Mesoflavibacter zeaxanthinifaciens subsp. sabulilitoris TaxID=1520893 RepID=A0A2T1NLZ9_9FLAO|nr:TolC family protein [Mesoflavibacter zeaxanthinifaciens]MBB3124528.1 outer membrane protein TolC [Mesoflavibacter zeaxanthinifaciens subsp. sabulilitoris]PSG93896.1 transporter [Mesoflavibacter zeaxanthinifaciens subsp. sabulilitoris]